MAALAALTAIALACAGAVLLIHDHQIYRLTGVGLIISAASILTIVLDWVNGD